jgi:quercetin dioxygenase-like cupin family protein
VEIEMTQANIAGSAKGSRTSAAGGAKAKPRRAPADASGSPGICKHSAVVETRGTQRIEVRSSDDPTIKWNAFFATYGGHGADQSSTIVYEIEPGGHLGWHTDATEETQYIVSGSGELRTEEGKFSVGPGSVFVLPTNLRHDLANTGDAPLCAVAFFASAMFTQDFDSEMLPPKTHILGTPNRNG